jgi:branched-chain amino acid transport system substrate-binding protein
MRRWFLSLLVFVLACGPTSVEQDTGPGEADTLAQLPVAGGEVSIGAFLSISGKNPKFLELRDGALLAIQEINASGGLAQKQNTKLALKLLDDHGTTDGAKEAVEQLVKQEKVVALIGEAISTLSLAAAESAQHYRIPMVTPSATDPGVTKKGPYIFRACFIDPFQGKALASFAKNSLQAKTAAIMVDTSKNYSVGLAAAFKEAFVGLGGKVSLQETYITNDANFTAQLQRIKQTQPDLLFLPGYFSDVATIAKQAKQQGLTADLLGGDGWDSPELLSLASGALEGAYFSTHYTAQDQSPVVQKFVAAFQQKYKVSPSAQAALGYDTVMLLADAMNRAATLKPSDIRAALAATKQVEGVTGQISFDAQRNASKNVAILKINNNSYQLQTRVEP